MEIEMEIPKTLREAVALHAQTHAGTQEASLLSSAAQAALAEERLDDAETLIRGLVIAAPRQAVSWRLAGTLAEVLGEDEEAESAYRLALDLEPDDESAVRLAALLAGDGRFEEALGWASSLALDSEDARVRDRAERLIEALEARRARG